MTEYDYSPAAVERYHQKLAEIGHWRDTTAQIRQKDPHSPPTPAFPHADLPHSKSSRRRTRSSDRDDYSDHRGRDDTGKHHRRRSTRDPAPPPPPPDRSRSVGPRPRTAPPRGDIYGLQQPPPASQFYPGPAPVQPYYPVPAGPGPGYMSAPPYPQQTRHTRSRSTSHAPAPAPPPPPPQPTRTRSYSFAPPPQQVPPPLRSASYPYTQPPPQNGKGYVYHPVPVPAYPPPGYASAPGPPPPPGHASAPQLVPVNPALFGQQPVRSPTKEVPLLKRVFGFGSKSRDGGSSRSKSRDGRRGDSY